MTNWAHLWLCHSCDWMYFSPFTMFLIFYIWSSNLNMATYWRNINVLKFRQAETAVAWITFPIQIGSRTRSPNWFSWLAWFTKCAWGGSSLNRICKSPSRSDLILSITPVRVMHVSTISNLLAFYTWFQSESLHFPGVDSETVTLDDDNGSGDVAWGDEEKPLLLAPLSSSEGIPLWSWLLLFLSPYHYYQIPFHNLHLDYGENIWTSRQLSFMRNYSFTISTRTFMRSIWTSCLSFLRINIRNKNKNNDQGGKQKRDYYPCCHSCRIGTRPILLAVLL